MTPTGLEPVCCFPQETLLPEQGDAESNALLAADVKLKVLLEAWPDLAESLLDALLAMVSNSRG
jgi:hypothetical protein